MILKPLKWKTTGTLLRLWQAFSWLPARLLRLVRHFYDLKNGSQKGRVSPLLISGHSLWLFELLFLFFDLLAVPEIYETLIDWGKWNTRPLTPSEIRMARSVFGNSIHYRRVRVDESARIVSRKTGILYVSFFTINCWGKFGDSLLIHELVHVWQFQKFGAVYIPRALLAQQTAEGYDYGGVEFLKKWSDKGGSLLDFNFEQQGDIIADGFCLRQNRKPRWARAGEEAGYIFEKYMAELQA